ncbi:MAG TPA: hypothetical protein VN041_18295 [Microbacterium sp.]|nr:hypothetical protein [Microbacterium sp.]
MSDRRPLVPLPVDRRSNLNWDLRSSELSALDDNARFIIRRMVAESYQAGYEHGWGAGQDDAHTDKAIARDQEEKLS